MISKSFKVVGNLKMHAVRDLLNQYANQVEDQRFGLLVPFPYLTLSQELFEHTSIWVGAQTVSASDQGAQTGEVSAKMMTDLGVGTVLIGHSEVRAHGRYMAKQIEQARSEGLKIIYCVGEQIAAFEQNQIESVLRQQLDDLQTFDGVTIAYEPVWAIGSGRVPTIAQMNRAIHIIKSYIGEKTSNFEEVDILYGGSVNNKNCLEMAHEANINGFLIGGTSLVVEKMLEVVNLCK